MPLNITPTRLKVLRFLADKPAGHNAKEVTAKCCPRAAGSWGQLQYTEQGLARMTGKVMKPLIAAGLIRDVNWQSGMYRMSVKLTDAGRELLAMHDKAASDAELAAAIESGA